MSLYNDAMIEGFLDELYEIEKNAQILPAIGKFFQGGIKGLHNAVNLAPKGTPFMRRMGVTHPEGLTAQLKGAYERGAAGGGGFLGGIKNVAQQQPVQIAGTVAAPLAAGYALG